MDIMEVENVDFNKLYKLHTGHRVFNESDDSSSSSESESDELFDIYKPPIYSYEELKANLVTYEPGNKTEGATTVNPNKDSYNNNTDGLKSVEERVLEQKKKLTLPDYCYICDANLAHPSNAKSHYNSFRHKTKAGIWKNRQLNKIKNATRDLENHNNTEPSGSGSPTFCSVCNIRTPSEEHMIQHLNGAKHASKLQEQSLYVPRRIITPVANNKVITRSMAAVAPQIISIKAKHSVDTKSVQNLKISDAVLAGPVSEVQNIIPSTETLYPLKGSYCDVLKLPQSMAKKAQDQKASIEPSKANTPTFCSLCNVNASSQQNMTQHVKGAKHKKMLQQQSSANVPERIVTPVIDNKDKSTNMPAVTQQSFPSKSEQSLEINSVANKVVDSVTAGPINEIQNDLSITATLDPRKAPHCEVLKLPPSETKEADDQKLVKPVRCILCNLNFFAQKDLSDHQNTFPHCELIGMKNELISQGIISEYWAVSNRRRVIVCFICDATLQESFSARNHLRSRRHIKSLYAWVRDYGRIGKTVISSWYYCDSCNMTLDGTSNADFHYQSNIHLLNNTNIIVKAEGSPQTPEINQTDSCEVVKAETNAQNSADCLHAASVVENNHLDHLDLDKSHDSAERSPVNIGSTLDISGTEAHSQLAINIEKPEVTSSTSLPDDSRNNMPDLLSNNMQMIYDASVTGCLVHNTLDCYVCKIKFKSRDELANHCKESPHKYIFKMKSYNVAKGILNEYWSIVNSDVKCTLCDLTLKNDSTIKSHFASKKHISRLNRWLQLETKDILAPSRKWFYCDLCSLELDGTTNADDHYGEEGHVRMQEILGAIIEQSLEHDIEFSELESKPEVTSHREPDFPYSSSANIENEENLHVKAEVLSELKELVNLVYFTKCIPPKIALKYLQKCNRELKRQNLTEQYFNTALRNQHDFKISNSASTNLRFKGSNDENNDCSSILTHEAHTNLEEKSSAIFHTVPEIPETRGSNGRFIFEIFAYGAAGIILLYLMKRS